MDWTAFLPCIRHLSHTEINKIQKAFDLAKKVHEGQLRKSGEPYFSHPVAVASILSEMNADAETIMAALLHDTVEDTDVSIEDIEQTFGPVVASLVDGVTKLNKEDVQNKPTLDEKIETLRKMFTLMQQDIRIMVIKLADRLHNIRTSEYLSEEKKQKLGKETQEIYVKIAEQLSMADLGDALEAGTMSLLYPTVFKEMQKMREKNTKNATHIAGEMFQELSSQFPAITQDIHTYPQPQDWLTLLNEQQNDVRQDSLSDVTVVFVCRDIDTCYRMMGLLHQEWRRVTLSFHDFINAPLLNGYKGLHTTVILPSGVHVHCNIRTKEMDEYAHKGIAALCFNGKALGIADVLPWTQRIGLLAEDTKEKSDEFFESLKSYILGDSITIHGPEDTTAMVPKESTALDAAFYLFGKIAPTISTIRVNGQVVPFNHPLRYADSLSIERAKESRLSLDWLSYVRTGFAVAQIRHALRDRSHKKKEAAGRELLQRFMIERHKGFLSEYGEKNLNNRAMSLGFPTLHSALLALADGDVSLVSLYNALFTTRMNDNANQKMETYSVSMHLPSNRQDADELIRFVQTQYQPRSFKAGYSKKGVNSFSFRSYLSRSNYMNVAKELQLRGAHAVSIEKTKSIVIDRILGAFLMLIWGLDPVFAHVFLAAGLPPVDFTVIRLISVFGIAVIAFLASQFRYSFSPLPFRPSILISGISFFAVSLFTYFALKNGSPSLYNSILRGNVLLVGLASAIQHRTKRFPPASMLIIVVGYALLLFISGFTDNVILCLGVLAAFFLYTLSSTRFQEHEKVLARYPQFFLYTSAIALICALVLSTKSTVLQLPVLTVSLLAVYSALFIGAPYILFFWLTKKYGYASVSPWIAWSLVITFAGEATIYGLNSVMHLIPPALLLIAGSLFSAREMGKAE